MNKDEEIERLYLEWKNAEEYTSELPSRNMTSTKEEREERKRRERAATLAMREYIKAKYGVETLFPDEQ